MIADNQKFHEVSGMAKENPVCQSSSNFPNVRFEGFQAQAKRPLAFSIEYGKLLKGPINPFLP